MNEQQITLNILPGTVPNQFPTTNATYRIAIVGEAPGETEVETGIPFSGVSGNFLNALLSSAGITRQACFVGNVCQTRPPGNNIKQFKFDGPEIQGGLRQLKEDLGQFRPNLCLLCGATPLLAATGEPRKPTEWRGSLFKCERLDSPFWGFKCLATLHPAYILRVYEDKPLLVFDLKRAREEGMSPELHLPERNLLIDLHPLELLDRLAGIPPGQLTSVDIEGDVASGMSCVSIATSPWESFLIPMGKFELRDEAMILRKFAEVMQNPQIPKALQNSLYDRMVLAYKYGIWIMNVQEDTMVKAWEIYPELPKALGVQASIYTREPFYKYERKVDDLPTRHRYCCKDSSVTHEISGVQDRVLRDSSLSHYRFNMELLSPLFYMQFRGWNFDKELADQKTKEVKLKMSESLARIATHAGYEFNPRSTQQCAKFLYQFKGYPTQYRKIPEEHTKVATTDTNALLTLGKTVKDQVLFEILTYRRLGKLLDVTESTVDPDGRLRCSYNLVGTETGRLNCSTSATGSGFNLQTVTKKLRVLFRADPGCTLFQCDLSGADGWTVAAHCAALGDNTMLDDYGRGLKPPKLIALFFEHPEFATLSRKELSEASKKVDPDGWLYFACKRVQHGTNYELGKHKMADQIMMDSFKLLGKPLYVQPRVCENLQRIYLSRYPGIRRWKEWVKKQVIDKGQLVGASGHTRKFFGRRKIGADVNHETFREALADEPQENTTYATNLALHKLWNDPTNRVVQGGITSLIIQPIHQVHDALIGQFPTDQLEECLPKIREYFNNTIRIAGMDVVIPFEGGYGENWGNCKTPI